MNFSHTARRAFTLFELLIAMVITLALAGLMLAIVGAVIGQWRRDRALADQATAAHHVLEALERDLHGAIAGDSDNCFAVEVINAPSGLANHGWLLGPGRTKPADASSVRFDETDGIAAARFGLSGAWLRFVATNLEAGGGGPTAIAYQLVRRPVSGNPVASNPAPSRYGLYRSAVGGAETFASGDDVTGPAYGSSSNTPGNAMSTAYRQPRNITNPSQANLLASNVVDFGCWLYARGPTGELERIFPGSSAPLSYRSRREMRDPNERFPEVVDVMVRILSDEGSAMLEGIETGRLQRPPEMVSDAAWWWSIVDGHSRVFVRRIEIKRSAP